MVINHQLFLLLILEILSNKENVSRDSSVSSFLAEMSSSLSFFLRKSFPLGTINLPLRSTIITNVPSGKG